MSEAEKNKQGYILEGNATNLTTDYEIKEEKTPEEKAEEKVEEEAKEEKENEFAVDNKDDKNDDDDDSDDDSDDDDKVEEEAKVCESCGKEMSKCHHYTDSEFPRIGNPLPANRLLHQYCRLVLLPNSTM